MTREQALARAFLHVVSERSVLERDPCNMVALGASLRLVDVAWPMMTFTSGKELDS